MGGRDINSLSKLDEAKALRSMEERRAKEEQMLQMQHMNNLRT
jgi:hypothetical protein